jgi:hypothetical protein
MASRTLGNALITHVDRVNGAIVFHERTGGLVSEWLEVDGELLAVIHRRHIASGPIGVGRSEGRVIGSEHDGQTEQNNS